MKKNRIGISTTILAVAMALSLAFSVVACSGHRKTPVDGDGGRQTGGDEGQQQDINKIDEQEVKNFFANLQTPDRNFSLEESISSFFEEENALTQKYSLYGINSENGTIFVENTSFDFKNQELYELDGNKPKKYSKLMNLADPDSAYNFESSSYCSQNEFLAKRNEVLDIVPDIKNQIDAITQKAKKCVYSGNTDMGTGESRVYINCTGVEDPIWGIVDYEISATYTDWNREIQNICVGIKFPKEYIPATMTDNLLDVQAFATNYNFSYNNDRASGNPEISSIKSDVKLEEIKKEDTIWVNKKNTGKSGGSESFSKEQDITLQVPAAPEGTSFEFDGWWYAADGSGEPMVKLEDNKLDITHIGADGANVFANWKNARLKFDFAGQELTEDSQKKLFGYLYYEDYASKINDLELKNQDYFIEGLYKDEEYKEKISASDKTLIEGDVTLYAKVVPKIKFTFSGTDFNISTFKCEIGDEPLPIRCPAYMLNTRDRVFKGWYEDADFAKPYDGKKDYTEDTTLYAKYVPASYTYNLELSEGAIAKTKTIPEFITFEEENSLKDLNSMLRKFTDVIAEKEDPTLYDEDGNYTGDPEPPKYVCTGWSVNAEDKVCKKMTEMPATRSTLYTIFEKVYTTDIYIIDTDNGYYSAPGHYSTDYKYTNDSEKHRLEKIDVLQGRRKYDNLLEYLNSLTSYKKFECEKKYNKLGWIVISREEAFKILDKDKDGFIDWDDHAESLLGFASLVDSEKYRLVDADTTWPEEDEIVVMIAEEYPAFKFKYEYLGDEYLSSEDRNSRITFDSGKAVGGDLNELYKYKGQTEYNYEFDLDDIMEEKFDENDEWLCNDWIGEETPVIWMNEEFKDRYKDFKNFLKTNLLLPAKEAKTEGYEAGVYFSAGQDEEARKRIDKNSILVRLYTKNENNEITEIDYGAWPEAGAEIYFQVEHTYNDLRIEPKQPYTNDKGEESIYYDNVNALYFKDCSFTEFGDIRSAFAMKDNICKEEDKTRFNFQYFLDKGIYTKTEFIEALRTDVLPAYEGIIKEQLKDPDMFNFTIEGNCVKIEGSTLKLDIIVEPKYPTITFVLWDVKPYEVYSVVNPDDLVDDVKIGSEYTKADYIFLTKEIQDKYLTFEDFLKANKLLPSERGGPEYNTLQFERTTIDSKTGEEIIDPKPYYIEKYYDYGRASSSINSITDAFYATWPKEHYEIRVQLAESA